MQGLSFDPNQGVGSDIWGLGYTPLFPPGMPDMGSPGMGSPDMGGGDPGMPMGAGFPAFAGMMGAGAATNPNSYYNAANTKMESAFGLQRQAQQAGTQGSDYPSSPIDKRTAWMLGLASIVGNALDKGAGTGFVQGFLASKTARIEQEHQQSQQKAEEKKQQLLLEAQQEAQRAGMIREQGQRMQQQQQQAIVQTQHKQQMMMTAIEKLTTGAKSEGDVDLRVAGMKAAGIDIPQPLIDAAKNSFHQDAQQKAAYGKSRLVMAYGDVWQKYQKNKDSITKDEADKWNAGVDAMENDPISPVPEGMLPRMVEGQTRQGKLDVANIAVKDKRVAVMDKQIADYDSKISDRAAKITQGETRLGILQQNANTAGARVSATLQGQLQAALSNHRTNLRAQIGDIGRQIDTVTMEIGKTMNTAQALKLNGKDENDPDVQAYTKRVVELQNKLVGLETDRKGFQDRFDAIAPTNQQNSGSYNVGGKSYTEAELRAEVGKSKNKAKAMKLFQQVTGHAY